MNNLVQQLEASPPVTSPVQSGRSTPWRKAELAVLIHYNFYLSFIFALTIGRLVFEKRAFYYCNPLQHSLLLPVFFVWLTSEIPRLYVGQRYEATLLLCSSMCV